jgi:DNA-directed RNA polymerase specialized sigma subunit
MKDKQKILEIMNLRFKDKLTYKEIAKEYGATVVWYEPC